MAFPIQRMRRVRGSVQLRNLVRETHLEPGDCIYPLFICSGEDVKREISSMPGNYQMSIDVAVRECEEIDSLGVGGIILFGIPPVKDEDATGAYHEHGIVQETVR